MPGIDDITRPVLILLGSAVILATLVPLLRKPQWWIRGFDFPRLQFAVVGALTLLSYGFVARYSVVDFVFLACLALAVVRQATHILPFTRLHPQKVVSLAPLRPDGMVRILVANVWMPNRQADRLLRIIRCADPDIVLTLETDRWWQDRLDALERDYPHTVKKPLDNLYGMHLYSRLALNDAEVRTLIQDDVPSIRAQVTLRSGQRFTLHCLHPAPPSPSESPDATPRDGELLTVGREIQAQPGPAVVTGDLNDVAWSDTTLLFRKISGLLDPRIGRGLFNTFHARYWFIRWPLDHLFHSDDFGLVSLRRLPRFGSDHFPILVTLCHAPTVARHQEAPDADGGDQARARARIEEAH